MKLAKFEQLLDDVSAHCLHHNEITDSLQQVTADLRQINIEAINGSDDSRDGLAVADELGSRLDLLQPSVDSCLQRAEGLLPSLAKQDVDIIQRQSQVISVLKNVVM